MSRRQHLAEERRSIPCVDRVQAMRPPLRPPIRNFHGYFTGERISVHRKLIAAQEMRIVLAARIQTAAAVPNPGSTVQTRVARLRRIAIGRLGTSANGWACGDSSSCRGWRYSPRGSGP